MVDKVADKPVMIVGLPKWILVSNKIKMIGPVTTETAIIPNTDTFWRVTNKMEIIQSVANRI